MKKFLFVLFFLYMCILIRIAIYIFCAFQEQVCYNGSFWKSLYPWLKDEINGWFHPIEFGRDI